MWVDLGGHLGTTRTHTQKWQKKWPKQIEKSKKKKKIWALVAPEAPSQTHPPSQAPLLWSQFFFLLKCVKIVGAQSSPQTLTSHYKKKPRFHSHYPENHKEKSSASTMGKVYFFAYHTGQVQFFHGVSYILQMICQLQCKNIFSKQKSTRNSN